jgi:hypothetical protein
MHPANLCTFAEKQLAAGVLLASLLFSAFISLTLWRRVGVEGHDMHPANLCTFTEKQLAAGVLPASRLFFRFISLPLWGRVGVGG